MRATYASFVLSLAAAVAETIERVVRHDVFALRALHHANGAVRLVILNLAQTAYFNPDFLSH
jgi:hypothetical protein